jgi:site-specific DNA-methyltransferase (adenine-specific)
VSVYRKAGIELRLGDWREVLADVEPDAVITDPPYSERTHSGHNAGADSTNAITGQATRQQLNYESIESVDVEVFALEWLTRSRGWVCVMNDHTAGPAFEQAAKSAGRYSFAPLPIIQKRPRLIGDGPSSWAVYLYVARPRSVAYSRWGCLPGAYFSQCDKTGIVAGAKPIQLMRQIVRDYTKPGDLVCDPCAGGATTLIAAAMEGRRAIGSEIDPATFEKAVKRIGRTTITPPLLGLTEQAPAEQKGLNFGGDES